MTDRPVLGIWGYSSDVPDVAHHDSGAAVVANGRVVAAVNEERITRRKNEGRWPVESIRTVLELANLKPDEIGTVALAGLKPLPRAALMIRELTGLARNTGILLPNRWFYALLTAKKLQRHGPNGFTAPVVFAGHHDAHAAAAYFTGPFERCAVVTLDGIGDSAHCGAVYRAENNTLTRIRTFTGYASPGILYSYVTKAFGYRPARHEGKITGLAARGDYTVLLPEFQKRLRYENKRLVSDFIPRLFGARVDADWATTWIDELLDQHSREDIAAALQKHTEDIAVAIARDALVDTGCTDIALAGGVFANVRVNQVIRELAGTMGGNIWIHPHMGDGGLSVGTALAHTRTRVAFPDAYLGDDIGPWSQSDLDPLGLAAAQPPDLPLAVARAIADGLIVGRAAGRMEYGPRALGNRTIFAGPENAAINDTLNQRLKRTEFMPFAPIMTERAAQQYLKNWSPADVASRFMTITYDVTDACRKVAPAIVHVDNTARPQVVARNSGFLEDLLVAYGKLKGHEVVINTSFNIHEEPIVRTARDAIRSWAQGAVDLLVLGDVLVARPEILRKVS